MPRNVLIAIDLGQPGTQPAVLSEGLRIAALDGAAVSAVTVVPPIGGAWFSGYFKEGTEERMLADAEAALSAFVDGRLGTGHGVRCITAHGQVHDAIVRTAAETGADLIVMGGHQPDFSDYFLAFGPNVALVARDATCSVYVVREPGQ